MAAFVPVAAGGLQTAAASRAVPLRLRPSRPAAAAAAGVRMGAAEPVGRRAALAALTAGALGVAAAAGGGPVWAADAEGDWVTTPSGLKYKDGTWRSGGVGGTQVGARSSA